MWVLLFWSGSGGRRNKLSEYPASVRVKGLHFDPLGKWTPCIRKCFCPEQRKDIWMQVVKVSGLEKVANL